MTLVTPLYFNTVTPNTDHITGSSTCSQCLPHDQQWTRSEPKPPKDILLWRGGQSDPDYQHSSFTGRVQLVDGELKNGDVSLILMNVSREDVGTYECRVITAGSRRNKRANIDTEPISIVELQVTGEFV
uniref:Ig-like domain-containing protein n=1 Tax=Sparus aurata TaxID=8175 RepID=A0A671V176_SPAAU